MALRRIFAALGSKGLKRSAVWILYKVYSFFRSNVRESYSGQPSPFGLNVSQPQVVTESIISHEMRDLISRRFLTRGAIICWDILVTTQFICFRGCGSLMLSKWDKVMEKNVYHYVFNLNPPSVTIWQRLPKI